jgi:predicted tellurium resistance membrane protein TerC
MLALLTDPQAWAALVTLTVLEVVLGVDNVIFISILVSRLEPKTADRVRKIGLSFAFIFRIALLATLSWIIGMTAPVFSLFGQAFSWRDLILIGGGLFLIAKATHEIHGEVEGPDTEEEMTGGAGSAAATWVIVQLIVIDLVFSLDSIITAIGMVGQIEIMIAAIVIAMALMYAASGSVARFIANHPTTKMLALAFLLLIGLALVADGFEFHIPRGYIYASMAFAAVVEVFNTLAGRNRRKKRKGSEP